MATTALISITADYFLPVLGFCKKEKNPKNGIKYAFSYFWLLSVNIMFSIPINVAGIRPLHYFIVE